MKNPSVSTLQCIFPYVSLLKPSKTHLNDGWLRIKSLSMYLLNWTWIRLKTPFNHRWSLLTLNFDRWNPNLSRSCSKNKFPATKYIYIYILYIYIFSLSLSLSLPLSPHIFDGYVSKKMLYLWFIPNIKTMVAPPKPNAPKKRGSTTLEPPGPPYLSWDPQCWGNNRTFKNQRKTMVNSEGRKKKN